MTLKNLFHLNVMTLRKCMTLQYLTKINRYPYLNKNFDEIHHLLSCTKKFFDTITISETRITKQVSLLNNLNLNNHSFEFTPTETSSGCTLLYIANH